MKLIILVFISLSFNINVVSQKADYKIMRDTLTKLSCKTLDSSTVVQTNIALIRIDTTLIDKNLDLYFRDLGWSYYRIYQFAKDTTALVNAIECYKKADTCKSNESATLWELAHLNYIIGNCETGKYYLDKFKNATEKQYWREDQIKLMTKRCDD